MVFFFHFSCCVNLKCSSKSRLRQSVIFSKGDGLGERWVRGEMGPLCFHCHKLPERDGDLKVNLLIKAYQLRRCRRRPSSTKMQLAPPKLERVMRKWESWLQ